MINYFTLNVLTLPLKLKIIYFFSFIYLFSYLRYMLSDHNKINIFFTIYECIVFVFHLFILIKQY